MVAYIDSHKDEFGIEPICAALQVAPSTYYAAKARLPSARARRDAVLGPLIMTLWVANNGVYGVHKMWKAPPPTRCCPACTHRAAASASHPLRRCCQRRGR
jgi:hypothetical protein